MIERLGGDFVQWLRGFYYTAKLGGVSAAAQCMGLRQPAVSHQLQALEKELGVRLFRRKAKAMVLTDEGRRLLERSIQLFEILREIKSEGGGSGREAIKGDISLATTHAVAQNQLPRRISEFASRYPEVRFTITAATEVSRIVSYVLDAETDMGIVQGQTFSAPLVSQPLFTSRLALIVLRSAAREHKWSFRRDAHGCLASFRELNNIPFIRFSPETLMARSIEGTFQRQGVLPRIVLTVNTSTLLKKYVEAGIGVTILDEVTAQADAARFDVYPLPGAEARQTYHLLTRVNRYLSPQAAAFIRFLKQPETRLPGAQQELFPEKDPLPKI